ncbi:hypothetical protein [Adhaeretor mobilis]|uniref:Cytochrome c domain-containing protein n=1 Tax=Adhaeretor mobilis TaxID=1930276 RepID=A0A517N314_9BACT|nr:hypothetical protein [Adhaeretor mobilis]QDT01530.1 hypothetical protein HG15A2_48720 [Adhaeretor mobilis]
MNHLHSIICLLVIAGLLPTVHASDDIDEAPIYYSTAEVNDGVTQLQAKLDAGKVKLSWDKRWGWLPAVLKQLEISQESQLLVFSKTSLQVHQISPHTPRALYYNDDAYIGYVPQGDILEVSVVDPVQGAMFYSLEQREVERPKFVRDKGTCLACHHNDRTRDVPGYLVRSVFPDRRGHALLSLGSETTDHRTPFDERFGGWYVTGTHGEMRHRGNAILKDEQDKINTEENANLLTIEKRIRNGAYLTPHSDIVSLMLLEHQSQMHNAITNASYEAREAAHYDTVWNEILKKPSGYQHEVSQRRLNRAAEELLACLLYSGEFQLKSPVKGTSNFVTEFTKLGPRDSKGRSLRDFDLQTRLFKYPCSYLIYSESFAALPSSIRAIIDTRLEAILTGEDTSEAFSHLSEKDRDVIREILSETLARG